MTQEMISKLTDEQLSQVLEWGQQELRDRTARHKQETIAKIRQLARAIEVGVKIEGTRGRPTKSALRKR